MQCDKYICSGAYAINVQCMHASGHGHIVHCIEFISVQYTDIVVSYPHMK